MSFERGAVFVDPETVSEYEDAVIVDVRSAKEYRSMGHVPGAVNVPYERIRDPSSVTAGHLPDPDDFAALLAEVGIEPDDPIVAYDGDRGVYAARFLLTAAVFGHDGELRLMDGDYSVWQQRFPTSTEPPQVSSTTYEVDPPDEPPIADRAAVEAAVEDDDGDAVLVDTRTPAEFDQSHIPGAVQLGWEDLVDDDSRRLKPRAEIEEILSVRGISPASPVVLYCNTARRLSHTYAVLRELGYDDVAFYEGSLTDWIRAAAPAWDPVELQRRVRSVADGGFDRLVSELADDVLNRLKLVGLYHQRQEGYFMLRVKIPGGILSGEQARVIGDVADKFARAPEEHGGADQNPIFGDGFLDVTTRQDVQLHWIRIEDVPEIWDRFEAVGLTTLQACGNSVRNVVGCPAAGIDENEVFDVRSVATEITDRFLGDRTYGNLPRKFKVSVTGCHENCARAHINDLGFTPAVKDGRDGFHVRIGGGLSDGPRMASDLDAFVEADQVVPLVEAAADVFVDHGSYLDTAVNRLRFVVEALGVETVRQEVDRRLPFELESGGESLTTDYRGDHVGVHPQEDGRHYVGLAVPTGRMLGTEFTDLAAVAKEYGDGGGEVRLTPNQNVLLPHVPDDRLDELLEESLLERYSPGPGPFSRGIVTCTGREFCSYGIVETKNRAIRWARQLDEWAAENLEDPPEVVRVHLSGCSASCAQPQIADVGLRGETYRDETGEHEGLDVGVGGDLGRERFVSWLATGEPAEPMPDRIAALVAAFCEAEREEVGEEDGEDFAGWAASVPDDRLYRLVTGSEEHAQPGGTAAATEGD